jgi:hypothetical protein
MPRKNENTDPKRKPKRKPKAKAKPSDEDVIVSLSRLRANPRRGGRGR